MNKLGRKTYIGQRVTMTVGSCLWEEWFESESVGNDPVTRRTLWSSEMNRSCFVKSGKGSVPAGGV